jgi:hypothetical protein
MYGLKVKVGKVFTSKFVGTGPSSYEKKNLPGRGLTKVENHWLNPFQSNFSANRILPSSYLFFAVKRLVDYL